MTLLLCVIASPVYDGFEGTDEVGPIVGGVAILAVIVGNGAAITGTIGKSKLRGGFDGLLVTRARMVTGRP